MNPKNRGRLLLACPDKQGIVAAVAQFLSARQANIVASDQYSTEGGGGTLFMRIVFDRIDLARHETEFCQAFAELAKQFDMTWRYAAVRKRKRMAVFVSKELHCLQEILWEWKSGQLDADIPLVVSNHPDGQEIAESFGIPYHIIPVSPENKPEAEAKQLALLKDIDVIVLARYMQILSQNFVKQYEHQVINIHHSFLPAFIGRNPYQRAYHRGVKLIGATAHYVTKDLDEGPIIEQDVTRVNHTYDASDLRIAGRSVERSVLARAVKWHLEDKVLVHGNKTIVFA